MGESLVLELCRNAKKFYTTIKLYMFSSNGIKIVKLSKPNLVQKFLSGPLCLVPNIK